MEKENKNNFNIFLDDFFGYYTNEDIENSQCMLLKKEEFNSLSYPKIENNPAQGDFYTHQKLFAKISMIDNFREFIILDETGTGKSCKFINVAEKFKKQYEEKRGRIKKTIILVKNDTLMDEIKKQIACKCTSGQYLDGVFISKSKNEEKSLSNQKSQLTNNLSNWYMIKTVATFYSEYHNMSDEKLINSFKNTLIIVDEVQKLIVDTRDAHDTTETNPGIKLGDIRNFLKKLFMLDMYRKVILITATPMINEVSDIISIFNMILKKDQELTADDIIGDTSEDIANKLYTKLKGKITFIKSMESKISLIDMGEKLEIYQDKNKKTLSTKVVKCKMRKFQRDKYDEINSSEINKGLRPNSRQASLFIFPNGKCGKNAMDEYLSETNKKNFKNLKTLKLFNFKYVSDELLEALKLEKIKKYSSIYWFILNDIINENFNGKFFFNTEFVEGSGLKILALAFYVNGFEILTKTQAVEENSFICSTSESLLKKPNISPKKRIIILTGETSGNNELKQLYENKYNWDGRYVMGMLGSFVTSEGLNLTNLQKVYQTPKWHMAGIYQAKTRGYRVDSFVELLKHKGNYKLQSYLLAAVTSKNAKKYTDNIDIQMILTAEDKDKRNLKIMRALKIIAVDCLIAKNRNILSPEFDNTRECDYQKCDYKCQEEDRCSLTDNICSSCTSNYFFEDEIEDIKIKIINYFRSNSFIYSFDLEKIFKPYNIKHIYMMLEKLMNDKVEILDSFYRKCYIKKHLGIFFLSPFENMSNSMDIFYTNTIYFNVFNNFDFYEKIVKKTINKELLSKESITIEFILKNYHESEIKRNSIIPIIEKYYTEDSLLGEQLRKIFGKFYFSCYDKSIVENVLKEVRSNTQYDTKKKKLTKRQIDELYTNLDKTEDYKKLKSQDLKEINDPKNILFHTLYYYVSIHDSPSHAKIVKLLRPSKDSFIKDKDPIRIYSNNQWTGADLYEILVYSHLIENSIRHKFPFPEADVYGFISPSFSSDYGKMNEDFYLIDEFLSKKTENDTRTEKVGGLCKNKSRHIILRSLYRLKKKDKPNDKTYKELDMSNKDKIIKKLKKRSIPETFLSEIDDIDELKFILLWTPKENREKKEKICELIYEELKKNKLIFVNYKNLIDIPKNITDGK